MSFLGLTRYEKDEEARVRILDFSAKSRFKCGDEPNFFLSKWRDDEGGNGVGSEGWTLRGLRSSTRLPSVTACPALKVNGGKPNVRTLAGVS